MACFLVIAVIMINYNQAAAAEAAVEKYSPVLKFDGSAEGYPMNAQIYLDHRCGGKHRCQNNQLDAVSNPTYFRILQSDEQNRTMDIAYWWFYGYQSACEPIKNLGAHDGDWEHIIVHVNDLMLETVTYFQHDGHYTTSGFERIDAHPVVYVGKVAHGSYHNRTPHGIGGGCGYFWDWRNPGHTLNSSNKDMNEFAV